MPSTNSTGPLVLIVDDLKSELRHHAETLAQYGIRSVRAATLQELDDVFDKYRNELEAVILDGCLEDHQPDTIEFVYRAVSSGFSGYLVAASSSGHYRERMVLAGCTHQSPKEEVAVFVADLLTRND
jgi:DNA-binding NtrC family response regulator